MFSYEEVSGNPNDQRDLLYSQIIQECEAMISFALASGKTLPGTLVQKFNELTVKADPGEDHSNESDSEIGKNQDRHPAKHHLSVNSKNRISQLVEIHNQLVQIVNPAFPGTILLLNQDSKKNTFWQTFGPLPIIRRMMFTAICCTAAFIIISLSDNVNAKSIVEGVFSSSGINLLLNLLFLITAAGIGASFSSLFDANKFIAEGTYDPKYESSYWIRFVLGLISGLLLAELIPIEAGQSLQTLSKPLLSLIGGFSSSVVYKVLNRLVTTVDTLISGKTKDMIASQKIDLQTHVEKEVTKNRLGVATDLIKLQKEMLHLEIPDNVKQKLGDMVDKLLPAEEESQIK